MYINVGLLIEQNSSFIHVVSIVNHMLLWEFCILFSFSHFFPSVEVTRDMTQSLHQPLTHKISDLGKNDKEKQSKNNCSHCFCNVISMFDRMMTMTMREKELRKDDVVRSRSRNVKEVVSCKSNQ